MWSAIRHSWPLSLVVYPTYSATRSTIATARGLGENKLSSDVTFKIYKLGFFEIEFPDYSTECKKVESSRIQPKTKLIAIRKLLTCFKKSKAHKECYAPMAIPDCNMAIAPAIDDDLHLFLEWANKWPETLVTTEPILEQLLAEGLTVQEWTKENSVIFCCGIQAIGNSQFTGLSTVFVMKTVVREMPSDRIKKKILNNKVFFVGH
uniref:Uncharacterized protein n=1 Tax=Romanomermis culicivorax TaxID=13658 RepID=A0A915L367_ROMCU